MPQISALTAATSVNPGDDLVIVQSGTTKKVDAYLLPVYAQTSAESAAGVTPTNYQYEPGHLRRYGTGATALQAAIDQNKEGGPEVVLPPGTETISASINVYNLTSIRGNGQQKSRLNYTGSAQLFKQATPGTRIYLLHMRDFDMVDTGSGTVGLDLDSVSSSVFENLSIDGFTTSVKVYSPTSGYAVYNRFNNVKAQNATTGFLFTGTSSNANVLMGCRGNVCTDSVLIEDSNDNVMIGCQFESGTDGVVVTASIAGLSDGNHIINCRFEANSGDAINIGANVRENMIVCNYFVSTGGAFTDNGTRTIVAHNAGLQVEKRIFATRNTGGSLYLENIAAALSSQPLAVFKDSNTGSGTPSTVEILTERNAGTALSVKRGGATYFAVTPAGSIRTANTAVNTNTPTGATARQLPIYDAAGSLLGYVPIYGSAW